MLSVMSADEQAKGNERVMSSQVKPATPTDMRMCGHAE